MPFDEFAVANGVQVIGPDGMVIYGLKCPIDITVADENGDPIAELTNNSWNIKRGYEPYFYVTACGEDSSGYFKVMAIPDTYTVSIKGTVNGEMDAVIADY